MMSVLLKFIVIILSVELVVVALIKRIDAFFIVVTVQSENMKPYQGKNRNN